MHIIELYSNYTSIVPKLGGAVLHTSQIRTIFCKNTENTFWNLTPNFCLPVLEVMYDVNWYTLLSSFGYFLQHLIKFSLFEYLLINLLLLCIFRLLIGYTEDKDDMFGEWKEWKGYAYAGGMFITAVIQSLALHQYFHKMMTIGMRMRTGIIGLVYEKVIYE